ncbi:monocarboxylate transporter 12 [Plakobranchus ocellatus]|uniref:Monocarboxylate transporter 12 n=1 Tax=Plakobranchus ocellatus TaxID=259542 RepID=A0AAV4CMD9_9GAST|nr:monocarboxylate transporter 12 [Plakobranchus ocellatus]
MNRPRDSLPSRGRESSKDTDTQGSSEVSLPVKYHPIDRGWAWIIMIGVFIIHFLTTGYLRSFGLLFVEFQNRFQSSSTITATMSGVQMLSYSIGTFVTMNFLMKHISVKTSCLMGCVLELLSVASNAVVTDIKHLIFTHGVIFGIGQALIYCPCMVILSEYFDKKRPIATVFATGGVSAGGAIMPYLIRFLIDTYGLVGGVLLLAGVIFQQTVFVSFFTAPTDYMPAVIQDTDSSSSEPSSKTTAHKHILDKTSSNAAESCDHISNNSTSHSQGDNTDQSHRDDNYTHNNSVAAKNSLALKDNTLHISYSDSSCPSHDHPSLPSKPGSSPSLASNHEHNPENGTRQIADKTSQGDEQSKFTAITPYPELKVTDSETENHCLLARTKQKSNSHTNVTEVSNNGLNNSQSYHLNGSNNELVDVTRSKNSLNSTHSATPSKNSFPRGKTSGACKEKVSKSLMHSLSFPSDTIARAMSTSSVDVLGSAHPMSNTSSTQSVKRRNTRRFSSETRNRLPESDHVRRYKFSRPRTNGRSPRFRLPKCMVPEIVKLPAFWLVAVYFCGGGVASVLPIVFLPPMAESRGLEESQASLFLVVSAITEMLGRLVPGLILHFGYMRPSTVGIPSMLSCGVLLQLVVFFTEFKSLLSLSCLIGFFTGSFWAMQVLIVIEIIGMESLGTAFGFYSIVLGFSVGAGFPAADFHVPMLPTLPVFSVSPGAMADKVK